MGTWQHSLCQSQLHTCPARITSTGCLCMSMLTHCSPHQHVQHLLEAHHFFISLSCRSPRASQPCQPKAGSATAQQTGPSCVQSADADQPCSASGGSTASATAACARCGCSLGQAPAECRFHPHLLSNPGPFLFSPEWHACKAAGHTEADAGCYVRAGHFVRDAALKLGAAAGQRVRASTQPDPETDVEQPRQRLPQPTMQ